jgi:hypothetical protein
VSQMHRNRQAVEAGLSRLPWQQRVVLLLADVHGLSYDQIAAATGASPGVVRARLSRARAGLRDYLFLHSDGGGLPGSARQQLAATTEDEAATPGDPGRAGPRGRNPVEQRLPGSAGRDAGLVPPHSGDGPEAAPWPLLLVLLLLLLFPFLYDLVQWVLARAAWR